MKEQEFKALTLEIQDGYYALYNMGTITESFEDYLREKVKEVPYIRSRILSMKGDNYDVNITDEEFIEMMIHQMKPATALRVKDFANFILWCEGNNLYYGHMEVLIQRAKNLAENSIDGKVYKICTVEFDGDIDDEDSKLIEGKEVLSFTKSGDAIVICSGL